MMRNNKLRGLALFLCIVILVISAGSVDGYASSAEEDLYKNVGETAQESGNDYFIKYRDNYELDTEEMSFYKDTGSVIIEMGNSFLFTMQKGIATLVISVFAFALSTDITDILSNYIQPFVDSMHQGLWSNLAVYAISLAAFVLLIKYAQNKTTQALSNFIALIMIIVLAFLFFAYPVELFEGVELVADGVSDEVLEGPYIAVAGGGSADDVKGKASALCWDMFVHKPWQILEFGSVETAKKYELDILKHKPGSDKRLDKVEDLAESEGLFSKSQPYQFSRLVTAAILFIFNVILEFLILAFALLILGYKILLLFYMLLGIFVFIIALLPAFGFELIRRWGMRTIGVAFTRVLVTFFLSIVLIFMDVIYGFVDTYGLTIVMMLMITSIVVIWFERHRIADLFIGYRSTGEQMPYTVRQSLNTDFNALEKVHAVRQRALISSAMRNTAGEEGNDLTAGNYGVTGNYVRNGSVSYDKKSAVVSNEIKTSAEAMSVSADKLRTVTDDMSAYFRHAEELLQKQYDYSKAKADAVAERNNAPAEYDDFVKRTEKVRSKGNGNFDSRDLTNVARIMQKTVEQGGSISDVVSDGTSIYRKNNSVARPADVTSVRTESISVRENVPERVQTVKGMDYFKQNFGEERGEELYGKLSQKYGVETIREFSPVVQERGLETEGKRDHKMSYAQVIKQLEQQNLKNSSQTEIKPEAHNIRNGDS